MGSFKLGRVFGFPIEVRHSFLILLGIVLFSGLLNGHPLLSLSLLLITFLSVLAHELGHALVARKLGVQIVGIDLHLFGGAAKMLGLPRGPKDEITISAAGPIVSLALALIGALLHALTGFWGFYYLMWTNLLLGLFNLVPALPMDGGRIFRAALAPKMGFAAATELAVKVTRGVAIALGLFGLFFNFWLAGLAVMLWIMASQELMVSRVMGYAAQPFAPSYAHAAGTRPGPSLWDRAKGSWRRAREPASSRRAQPVEAELLDHDGTPLGRVGGEPSPMNTGGAGYTIETTGNGGSQLWIVRDVHGRILLRSEHPLS